MNRFSRKMVIGSAAVLFGLASVLPIMASAAEMPGASAPAEHKAMDKMPAKHAKKAAHKKVAANAKVKAVQEALDKAGMKLKADGIMGPKTRAALKKYQKENGLKVTGKADKATMEKLGVK